MVVGGVSLTVGSITTFWLLHRTVNLVRCLPFDERLKRTRPLDRGHTLLLPFLHLRNGLLANKSLPLTVFHFCAKGDEKKELDRNYRKVKRNNGLTLMCLCAVTTGTVSWLGTLTVPM